MGNYRFRLSDMIPNAWFYKLKDMGRGRSRSRSRSQSTSHQPNSKKHFSTAIATATATQQKQQNISQHRRSYYYKPEPFKADRLYNSPTNPKVSDTHFPEPPKKSSKRGSRRRSIKSSSSSSSKLITSSSSVSTGHSCRATLDSVWVKSDSTSEDSASPLYSSPEPELHGSFQQLEFGSDRFKRLSSCPSSCSCRIASSANKFSSTKFDSIPEVELPPILTKPAKFNDMISDVKKKKETAIPAKFRRSSAKLEERNAGGSLSVKVIKEESIQTLKDEKISPSIRRLKIRANSPRIASRKINQAYSRKSSRSRKKNVSESFAIVKSSMDPQRDFRDSMLEMIVENNIRASKDLEELLACYLSLNSNEYHDLIVKVFEQIWFDLTDIEL